MTRYCTLARAKQEIKKSTASKTLDDAILLNNILAASKRIDKLLQPSRWAKRPFFAPYIESRKIQIRPYVVNSQNQTFDMGMWLLEFTAILAGAKAITSKIRGYLPAQPPFDKLQINDGTYANWYTIECNSSNVRSVPEPLTVTGTWGWADDWDVDFVATATLDAAMNTTVTTVPVQAGEGVLFSPGNLIKVDDEYMEVTLVTTDTLTITRGQNGTTTASHLDDAPVSIWQIPEDIQRITARQASHMYARRGAFDVQQITELGTIQYPQDLLVEIINTIDAYRSV